jgi:hypothetical protein
MEEWVKHIIQLINAYVRSNIPIRLFKRLIIVSSNEFGCKNKGEYLSYHSIIEFIDSIDFFYESKRKNIEKISHFHSISADISKDVSNKEQLAVMQTIVNTISLDYQCFFIGTKDVGLEGFY